MDYYIKSTQWRNFLTLGCTDRHGSPLPNDAGGLHHLYEEDHPIRLTTRLLPGEQRAYVTLLNTWSPGVNLPPRGEICPL
jgi:hypothetical protein